MEKSCCSFKLILPLAALQSPVMHSAIRTTAAKMGMFTTGASPKRGYAAVADRRTIDEIHRKEGVVPGQKGTCPHASAGIAAARTADKLAEEHRQQLGESSSQPTSFETGPLSSKQDARNAAASTSTLAGDSAMRMNSANPLFDYNSFYAEELDKKHKDKSYRCVQFLSYSYTLSLSSLSFSLLFVRFK